MTQMRVVLLIVISILSGCGAPRYSYQDSVPVAQLQTGNMQKFRVLAAVEEWRDSGVTVTLGQSYQITAKGKWRTYASCNWTDADGLGLYNTACFKTPLFPELVQGWSHSALVAKIEPQGNPFAIGKNKELIPQSSGRLYFRVNDVVGGNWDNEGYVDVSVKQLSKQQEKLISNPLKLISKQIPGVVDNNHDTYIAQNQAIQSNLKRFALIIGNSDYDFSPLNNPVNDATDMAAALKTIGFNVHLELNANQQQMEEAIDAFGRQLTPGSVALFYFAGHGVQLNGNNYLIPVNAVLKRQSDVRYKAVNTGQVLNAMGDSKNILNIIILDACRNNPLPRSFRSTSRGLARMEGPKGTILGFATSPGSVAADGMNKNGVYTEQLLKHIRTPNISIEQVFKRVLKGVNNATKGKQVPWTESSFTGDFSFVRN